MEERDAETGDEEKEEGRERWRERGTGQRRLLLAVEK